MNSDIERVHPVSLVEKLLGVEYRNAVLEFSTYQYVPQSLCDDRDVFRVPSSSVNAQWLSNVVESLKPGFDLSLHSRIYLADGRMMHIPMIDFEAGAESLEEIVAAMRATKVDVTLFESGRSFHGYGKVLLDSGDWFSWLGKVLLMDKPADRKIVDSRWVGHRLIAGYGSLRWSCNSPCYKSEPSLAMGCDWVSTAEESRLPV